MLYQRKSVAFYRDYIDDNLAVLYADSATLYYERAFTNPNMLIANSYFNKGTMQREIGRIEEGKESIEIALDRLQQIQRQLPDEDLDSIKVNWNFDLVRIYTQKGDFKTALEKARQLISENELNRFNEKRFTNQLGLINLAQGNYRSAKDRFSYLVEVLHADEDITYRGNLGLAFLNLQDFDKGATYLEEANQAWKNLLNQTDNNYNRRYLSNSHSNLFQLYLELGDWNKADYHITEALALLRKVDNTESMIRFAELYFKKSRLEHALGDYDSSLFFLETAIDIVAPELFHTGTEEQISIIGNFKEALEIIAFRAQVLAEQGELNKALDDVMLLNRLVTQSRRTYQSSLSKYFLIQKVVPVYELGIRLNRELYAQTGDREYLEQAYALNARNKAILLLESLQSERAMTFAGLPAEIQGQERELRDAVSEQESLLYQAYQQGDDIDSLQSVVFEQEQAYYQFIQQLERDYPAYYELKYSADRPPVSNEIQDKLESDQVLLEYFTGQDSIYTFLMDGREMRVYSKAKPAGFVDSVALFRELLTNGIEKDCEQTYIRLGRYFYDLLLAEPLGSLGEHKQRLVVVPDGLLNFLSFEAFIYKDLERLQGAEGFLVEKYAFSYAYSSKLLLEEEYYPRSATKGFAGFGMEYDDYTLDYLQELEYGDWKYVDTTLVLPCGQLKDTTRYYGKLIYSDDEVRDIAALAEGDSWLNEEVMKQSFMDNANGYKLLHLAMHGTYDLEFPMNSSLIFSRRDSTDIFLRAADIYNMELDGDMAVLSACNTAYGKLQAGEGPMTLARAFHYAGIPAVVASLWSIPDNSTSRIMRLFYQELDKGLSKDVALQQAKLAYLASDDLSSPNSRQPLHWAPTIVIGDVAPVPISPRSNWWWILLGAGILLGGYLMVRRGKANDAIS